MDIVIPSPRQLENCYALETGFAADVPDAEEQGFFLPGATFDLYEDLLQSGYVRCIAGEGQSVDSYIVAVPPGHEIVRRMLVGNAALVWTGDAPVIDVARAVWIAKIATSPARKREGFAAFLYARLYSDFPGADIFTATALEPLRNRPSESFHENQGFVSCGRFFSGRKGGLENVVSQVWMKAGHS